MSDLLSSFRIIQKWPCSYGSVITSIDETRATEKFHTSESRILQLYDKNKFKF